MERRPASCLVMAAGMAAGSLRRARRVCMCVRVRVRVCVHLCVCACARVRVCAPAGGGGGCMHLGCPHQAALRPRDQDSGARGDVDLLPGCVLWHRRRALCLLGPGPIPTPSEAANATTKGGGSQRCATAVRGQRLRLHVQYGCHGDGLLGWRRPNLRPIGRLCRRRGAG